MYALGVSLRDDADPPKKDFVRRTKNEVSRSVLWGGVAEFDWSAAIFRHTGHISGSGGKTLTLNDPYRKRKRRLFDSHTYLARKV
jgi:hypothetical protein